MSQENLPHSPSARKTVDQQVAEAVTERRAREHCRCDAGEVHAHCQSRGCNSRLAEGDVECEVCKEKRERRRDCYKCHATFYLPPAGEPASRCYQLGFCSQKCYEDRFAQRMEMAGVPKLFCGLSLKRFDAYTPELATKLSVINRWLDTLRDSISNPNLSTGLLLLGKVGTGKTHLAVGVMRELIRRGLKGSFIEAPDFARRCQSACFRNENFGDVVDGLLEDDFLVLDDLGSEKPTDFLRQSLEYLVNKAYTGKKILIVTSNLSLEQIDRFSPRIASRLALMGPIEFDGDDYRLLLAEKRMQAMREV